MKNFKIDFYEKPNNNSIFTRDKYFCLSLQSDIIIRISSHKRMLKTIADIESLVNNYILSVNMKISELYKYYRTANYYSDLYIFDSFINCDKYIKKILQLQNTANKVYFAFSFMIKLNDEILHISKIIADVLKKNNLWFDLRIIQALSASLQTEFKNMVQQIKNYNEFENGKK